MRALFRGESKPGRRALGPGGIYEEGMITVARQSPDCSPHGPRFLRLAWLALPTVVGLLAVAPFLTGGSVLLLDWLIGPHMKVPRALWGLDGGLQAGLPFQLLAVGLQRILGHDVASWLPIAVFFPIAGWSAGWLVGGPPRRRVAAAVLYMVNPLVFDRLWVGHLAFLMMYAILPLFTGLSLRPRGLGARDGARAALLLGAGVALTSHALWIFLMVLLVAVVAKPTLRSLCWAAAVVASALTTNAYLLVSVLGHAPGAVGAADLASYRTRGDGAALYLNVATLYGFWRREPVLPRDVLPGAPLFAVAILLLVGVGAWRLLTDRSTRGWALALMGIGVVGFALALGDRGPTGSAFRAMYDAVPPFRVMREPQKFLALLALTYSCFFGYGVEALVTAGMGRRITSLTALTAGVMLPFFATPTVLLGLGGGVRPVEFPSSWERAQTAMGEGQGKILFLPWHQYLSFPFTGRVIANPAPAYFSRDVISGDNVELPRLRSSSTSRRSRYLESLYVRGPSICNFGELVSPLGVEYVILAKTVDSGNYAWLARQSDLSRLPSDKDLIVYRNLRWHGVGTVGDGGFVPPMSRAPCLPPSDESRAILAPVRQISPVAFSTRHRGRADLAIAEPFDAGWMVRGASGRPTAQGTVGFSGVRGPITVRFGPWRAVRVGFVVSGVGAGVLVAMSMLAGQRRRGFGRDC